MDDNKKLDFVLKMTKHALAHVQHFDGGGTALGGTTTAGTNNAANPNTSGVAGAIGNVLGTNNDFQATGATIQQGTNGAQLNQAYNGVQGALGQAGNLANTLNPGVQQGVNSQGALTNELGAEASGQNSTAAQTVLNQNTGQNIAQQAALMAGQRGAGGNAGLLASQAAGQGAATQQQAVGQAATTAAGNQLAAQGQLAGLASTQVDQGANATQLNNQTQQNEQNILQGANTAGNNANVSMQENINSTNAAVAGGNQNANQNVLSNVGNAVGGIGSALSLFAKGGQVPEHFHAMARIVHPHLYAHGGAASFQMSAPVSSSINGGSTASMPSYNGSKIDPSNFKASPKADPGQTTQAAGDINSSQMPDVSNNFGTAGPFAADNASQMPSAGDQIAFDAGATTMAPPGNIQAEAQGGGISSLMQLAPLLLAAKGGMAKLPPSKMSVGSKMREGGKVPGKDPAGKHDSYKNDVVAAKLSPGEVVIDLNTLNDKGKLGQMARFVAQNIERKKAGRALK